MTLAAPTQEMATVPAAFERVCLREIDLNITNRCNLNCIHCAFASSSKDANELPLEVIAQIIEDARALGCETIHLTGGEPTVHRQFDQVLELILSAGILTRLISNGMMSRAKLARWRGMGLRHLLVSADGLEQTHDRIRGRPGAFSRAMRRVQDALELGYHVRVNAVAMRDNLGEMVPLFEECERLGAQLFSVFLYSPTGRNARQQLDLVVDPYQWRDAKVMLRARCEGSRTEVFVEKGFLFADEPADDYASTAGRGGGCYHLSTVLDYLLITGDGNVFPCALLNEKGIPYGNVYARRLPEIIKQPERHYLVYRSFREPAGKCARCEAWDRCHGGCRAFAYAFHQAWDHPDPQCIAEPGHPPSFIPLCPLFKEDLRGSAISGFSESLGSEL